MGQIMSRCDECGSEYLKDASKMKHLCPECAHRLYGYENCSHEFEYGRCKNCLWDGSSSRYLDSFKENDK